jgi:hypothetical protein
MLFGMLLVVEVAIPRLALIAVCLSDNEGVELMSAPFGRCDDEKRFSQRTHLMGGERIRNDVNKLFLCRSHDSHGEHENIYLCRITSWSSHRQKSMFYATISLSIKLDEAFLV